jgi:hypothetical protein
MHALMHAACAVIVMLCRSTVCTKFESYFIYYWSRFIIIIGFMMSPLKGGWIFDEETMKGIE